MRETPQQTVDVGSNSSRVDRAKDSTKQGERATKQVGMACNAFTSLWHLMYSPRSESRPLMSTTLASACPQHGGLVAIQDMLPYKTCSPRGLSTHAPLAPLAAFQVCPCCHAQVAIQLAACLKPKDTLRCQRLRCDA